MSSIFSIALSGLNDAVRRVANATSNMVNASSTARLPENSSDAYTGFVPQDVVTLSNGIGGVNSVAQPRDPAYVTAFEPNSPLANVQGLVAQPNVDLNAELVSNIVSANIYAANVATIKTAKKMEDSLLDIIS
ncbi:MAG: flagellar basal body rod C-terminal domain-containing protein [Alphaproteobacteria bacterium]|nr:flagellar basal body rod C-terminal domain-containing protein [Alphaproteobacteria bacterium]